MKIVGCSFFDILEKVKTADFHASLAATQSALGNMKQRIHNDGINSQGAPIGQYRNSKWKRKRERSKPAKQTDYVDLQFNGDLFKGYQSGRVDGSAVIGFTSEDQYIKAEGLTNGNQYWDGYGDVFALTTEEIDAAFDNYLDQLDKEFDALFRDC